MLFVNYIKSLFRNDKPLFFLLLIIGVFQSYFIRVDRESFPFVHYAMYSLPYKANDTIDVLGICINGTALTEMRFTESKNEMIASPINHAYDSYHSNQWTKSQWNSFIDWWVCLLRDQLGDGISVSLEADKALYDVKGNVKVVDSLTVYER